MKRRKRVWKVGDMPVTFTICRRLGGERWFVVGELPNGMKDIVFVRSGAPQEDDRVKSVLTRNLARDLAARS